MISQFTCKTGDYIKCININYPNNIEVSPNFKLIKNHIYTIYDFDEILVRLKEDPNKLSYGIHRFIKVNLLSNKIRKLKKLLDK
jgi:hypothetical protein